MASFRDPSAVMWDIFELLCLFKVYVTSVHLSCSHCAFFSLPHHYISPALILCIQIICLHTVGARERTLYWCIKVCFNSFLGTTHLPWLSRWHHLLFCPPGVCVRILQQTVMQDLCVCVWFSSDDVLVWMKSPLSCENWRVMQLHQLSGFYCSRLGCFCKAGFGSGVIGDLDGWCVMNECMNDILLVC